jgi:dipeptidyl aminopeptidase/acylaminoacyl peptidase
MPRALPVLRALVVVLLSMAALVQPPAAGAPPGAAAWTVDDILLEESASDFAVSPDGRRVAWVKGRMDKEKGERVANLVLSRLDGEGGEVPLTRGKDRDSGPRWSPDGRTLAFLSTRPRPAEGRDEDGEKDARTQLWLLSLDGGEPWPLTKLDRGLEGFAWKDDATIVIAAPEEKSLRERKEKEGKDTSQVVEDEREAPVRLFAVDVRSGTLSRLTDNRDWIEWVEVSPDGRWAVALHRVSLSFQFDNRVPPFLRLHDLRSGASRTLLEGTRVLAAGAVWAPDSKGFYFVQPYSSHPTYYTATIQLLQYVDAETGGATPVDLQWANGLGTPRVLPVSDGFLALLADGVRHRPARYRRSASGWAREDLSGEHAGNVFDWAASRDGTTLVYEHSKATKPAQWYRASLDGATIGAPATLTDLNPGFRGKPVHQVEVVTFKGARDDDVVGLLYYPIGYEKGKRYPLLLSIHGGPAGGADMDVWDQSYAYPKLLIAQKGAFLLEVNYHGGSNFGLDWVESICCGNYYDLERVDLEAGVDHVISLGLADPDRIGTMGWSNGSILTTELVTRSRRYRVASAGAGDVEWISDWGNVDFGAAFDNYYFGKAPYEDPELYVRKSPFFRLRDVTTPTIIYTGTEDRNVPPSQSWSHFRVMQQATKTPVRFVLFPGEPHGLRKYAHQRRKVEEDLAWFDRHLFGGRPEDPVVKDGSPLQAALERKAFAREGGRYGRLVKGRLVPEAVVHEGLRVARFEVTRAQYAACDPSHRFPAGTFDWPASGIPFEKAKAYAAWLTALTGEPWRLPTAEEARTLYGKDREGENTLDRWAGYPPSPEDAARLRETAAVLGGEAPLLDEVGRHAPRGAGTKVYDLGGNVAEWTVGPDSRGLLAGGSADQPAGTPGPATQAAEAYRGFRVVSGGTKAEGAP